MFWGSFAPWILGSFVPLGQAEVDPPDSENYLNAAVSEAVFEGGKWTIVRWNDASHINGVSTLSFSIDGK